MSKKYRTWICDCLPPLPDVMSSTENKCEICGMKKKDIIKRIKKAIKEKNIIILKQKSKKKKIIIEKKQNKYCPVCQIICDNKIHQKFLYRTQYQYFEIENGKPVLKLTKKGLERIKK